MIFIIYALIICNLFNPIRITTAADSSANNSMVVCPLNLTQNLPCMCHVLAKKDAVQINCNKTQPDNVWRMLDEYSFNIDKIAFRNCPNKIETLQKIPALKVHFGP